MRLPRGRSTLCAAIAAATSTLVGCGTHARDAARDAGDPPRLVAHPPPGVIATHQPSSVERDEALHCEGSRVLGARELPESVRRRLTKQRGYPGSLGVRCRFVESSEWQALLTHELDALTPPDVGRELDLALIAFGLFPAGYDSRRALVEQLHRDPRGVYLSGAREIALPERSFDAPDTSLLHELVHAYQDRDHGLGKALRYRPNASDEIAATLAFAEGEALLLERLLTLEPGEKAPSPESLRESLDGARQRLGLPSLMGRSLMAPYVDGYRFVTYVKQLGGWPLVERIWRRGLASTAELLHPESWLDACTAGDCARATPKALPETWLEPRSPSSGDPPRYSEPMGEQGLRLVLEEVLSETEASELSRHLEVDRLSTYSLEQQRDIVWRLRVDESRATTTLCHALRAALSLGVASDPVAEPAPFRTHAPAPVAAPASSCIRRKHSLGVVECGGRDILALFRSHADTWTPAFTDARCRNLTAQVAATLRAHPVERL